jgi:hypothetical protein
MNMSQAILNVWHTIKNNLFVEKLFLLYHNAIDLEPA